MRIQINYISYYYNSNMFSDMHSVRSVPISSNKKKLSSRPVPLPSVYSPSEDSPIHSKIRSSESWRNNLHP